MIQWNVHQQITIHQLRVGTVSNSSVFQIGSAGTIQSLSQLFNTGGYTGPAPQVTEVEPGAVPGQIPSEAPAESSQLSLVPFPNPR